MKAVELINRALVLAGIVSVGFDQPEGPEGSDGLFWLNQILGELQTTGLEIPYITEILLPTIAGQEFYDVPNLIVTEAVTFNLDNVRFSMKRVDIKQYKNTFRVNNIETLMYEYYVQRILGGSRIELYFIPNQVYEVTINGRFALSQVTFNTDLSTVIDQYYVSYLMYLLAERLTQWYKISLNPSVKVQLEQFRKRIMKVNPLDHSFEPSRLLSPGGTINWGTVNLSGGWTVP
jgi:hypothetical protein